MVSRPWGRRAPTGQKGAPSGRPLPGLHLADLLRAEGLLQELEGLLLAGLPRGLLVDHLVERFVTGVEPLITGHVSYRRVVVGVERRLVGALPARARCRPLVVRRPRRAPASRLPAARPLAGLPATARA